jgi:hypothetical protein
MASPYGTAVQTTPANYTGGSSTELKPGTPAVAEAVGQMQANLNVLHDLLGKLESRIDAVLRPVASTPSDASSRDPRVASPVVPLAGVLTDLNLSLITAHSRIFNLIDRVEL